MLLDPLGRMLFVEIGKRLRDCKWVVDDRELVHEEVVMAQFLLPDHLVEREDDAAFGKVVATLGYEGTVTDFKENEVEGIRLTFNLPQLRALGLEEMVSCVEPFCVKGKKDRIEFLIDEPFASDRVQEWIESLFTGIQEKMLEVYGDDVKEIPIVLLPTRFQELPIYEA